jgi:hypothetical protein
MSLICHTMILMLFMFFWEIKLEKSLPCMLGHITRGERFVCGCSSALLLIWKDPIKLGYLKIKPNLFYRLTPLVEQCGCLIVDALIIWSGREGYSRHLRRIIVQVIVSHLVIIAMAKSLVSVKHYKKPVGLWWFSRDVLGKHHKHA